LYPGSENGRSGNGTCAGSHRSEDQKCFRQKLWRKSEHVLCVVTFFFFENPAVYDMMSENVVEIEGTQMTSQYSAYELHAG
jgi:hypothetical protein